MLVLSRRPQETIVLPTLNVTVQVLGVKAGAVRLGVTAPPEVKVLRGELTGRDEPCPADAAPARPGLDAVVHKRLGVVGVGLGLLRGRLQSGRTEEAATILDKVEEEVRMLRRRVVGGGPSPAAGRPAPRALLVEDNANERQLMASLLRLQGFAVDTAGDGLDALDYLRARGKPDVVLLDMGLPRCDGPTALRAIRADPALAGLKVFAVSGGAPEDFGCPPGPAGVDRWFQKPIDPAALIRDVSSDLQGA
jgi:carbon storage regulator CsrA